MKPKVSRITWLSLAAVAMLVTLNAPLATALAQGTAFTYQGRLDAAGAPYTGSAEMQFRLWTANAGGSQVGGTLTVTPVGVTNGLFTVALDFGSQFSGANRWLELAVRTNAGVAFATLIPRQALTAAPYAITAGNLSGALPASQLSGTVPSANLGGTYSGAVTFNNAANTFTGSGAGLTGLNAGNLTGTVPDARLSANVALLNGSQTFSAPATLGSTLRFNDSKLYFRTGTDYFHGLGWFASATFGNNPDGPVLFGNGGGALGYTGNGTNLALTWNNAGNVAVDPSSANAGTLLPGLTFGYGSGEGISSKRTSGGNQYGLDFYTGFANRLSITSGGNVGIGLTNPGTKLEVAGTVRATSFVGNGAGLTNIPAAAIGTPPPGMVLVPVGAFTMGNVFGDADITDATPVSTTVSAFFMDVNEVTWSQWQSVYFWATNHGYGFVNPGAGKAANHPVQTVDWYDCVKWCNARSQQAGKSPVYYTDAGLTRVYTNGEGTVYANWSAQGYRLPTEAEWEKAARGGVTGQRFPWGNVINQNLANYYGVTASYSYDLGPNGYNAAFTNGVEPYTSPGESFAANGYGLNDMAGNVYEWCWDWYGTPYAGGSDPRGPASGSARVLRGGCYYGMPIVCRTADRYSNGPHFSYRGMGFRSVLPPGQ